MNRTAFTLIELMIVIAIMGVVFVGLYPAFPALSNYSARYQKTIAENTSLTLAYNLIRNCLKDSQRIVKIVDGRIFLDNDYYIAIENFGQQLRINGHVLKLAGRATISEIEHVSDTMFITRVNTGVDSIRVIWKVGVGYE
ncbi:MAG: prepilin-type N-terminal cleavage/methylation domain-containing protein [Candidatus Riflebacteria bacterium]|nr:prepilin-type N-terminal cleavage/methylation domain-containing protein [Candidatus Riflebacteria bacterium]